MCQYVDPIGDKHLQIRDAIRGDKYAKRGQIR
jgi:hypothetical protein